MPFSELLRMAKGKGESTSNQKITDLSFVPGNDFVELVWENGQIMMQGQPSRTRKSPATACNNFQSQTHKFRDKDVTNSRVAKFGIMDFILNDFPMGGLNQDDDMVPWLSLPLEEPLQQDYYTDFLPELSGVTVNELSTTHNNFTAFGKRNTCSNQATRDSYASSVHNNGLSLEHDNASRVSAAGDMPSKPSASHAYSSSLSSQQCQALGPYFRSKAPDVITNNTSNTHHSVSTPGTKMQKPDPGTKMQKPDPGSSSSNLGFTNFSHFSRPLIKANLQSVGAIGSKDSAAINSNPIESTPINSSNPPLQKEMGSLNQSNSVPAQEASAKSLKESLLVERSEAICRDDAIKNDKSPNRIVGANAAEGIQDGEKVIEPVVASSSVCSGNSVERASNNPTHNIKRKHRDMEDSECPSEDVEEDSVGARKAASARGTGSKRSRAAEVHNLSERRRRDRINEKMRALQELIPNCNKVDKASMLDEAIEYLKTLQLQVQIMSMGTGLCMPPMMLPTGMQHMHVAPMQHFSPMGVGMGMGMGMGFGMGMLEMNGGAPGCSMIQAPHMQRPYFPGPPISGTTGVHAVAGPNFQVFGLPGQGFPVSTPHTPIIPFSGGASTTPVMGNASGAVGADSANPSNSKEPMKNLNLQVLHNSHPNGSINQTSAQGQATKEGIGQEAQDGGGSKAVIGE